MRPGTAAPNFVLALATIAIAARLGLPAVHVAQARAAAGEVVRAVEQTAAALRAGADARDTLPAQGSGRGVSGSASPGTGNVRSLQGAGFGVDGRLWPLGEVLNPLIRGDAVGIITVRIPDPRIRQAFRRLARSSVWLEWDDSFAFLVPGA